jgi:hypothetical protein
MSNLLLNQLQPDNSNYLGEDPSSIGDANMTTLQITDDLDSLLNILPERIRTELQRDNRLAELIEVILDLGRLPEARFSAGEAYLSETEITV